ncbi:RHS repeat domain-containing protein [Flavobacterium sp. HNIBRBA15423]|uniref:RHS repeat domain-containing protein n=1 Tax=Flavobacterium sp. HNIBRBA15423 TaxID=3458683 RepID=UPI0040446903
MITKNTYDELGQLISKNVGGLDVTGASGLQTVDYSYNIRGWLKNINDVNNIGNDLFAFKINYNDAETATDLYNGNISETFWKTNSDNKLRKYQFSYDNLNRLLNASYSRINETTAPNAYREQLDYDKNGNIQKLNRYGVIDDATYAIQIDELVYAYDPQNKNQLLAVEDKSQSPKGFKDGVNEGNDYEYDANGNLIADKNKEIETIIYNHLNLPTEINFASADKIEYLYNATGQKVTKIVTQTGIKTQTDYLAGGFQYKVNELQFFPHPEGYVNVIDDKYNYVFNYTDHLGNIRVSYGVDPSTSTLKLLEENHYYPFGLKHEGYNMDYKMYQKIQSGAIAIRLAAPLLPNYHYRFNSREYQGELALNVTAMDYRQYDSAIGRFNSMDKLSEMSHNITPYRYGFNNPVFWSDPTGLFESRREARAYRREHGLEEQKMEHLNYMVKKEWFIVLVMIHHTLQLIQIQMMELLLLI